ncbi:MAG: bifunctional 4-hydroxy-2-oxoglutarate aldolase/2-dehydro-3-deoxy-phosphogluconate aldolase [Candidatus Omnitrophota bacterium]
MNINEFKKLPLMGIIRGITLEKIEPLLEAVIKAGLKTIEVTMNTPNVLNTISKACDISKGRISIGAGTVLSGEDAQKAVDAGAEFIVLPCLVPDVVNFCAKKNIPVFPGAFTPLEVYNAWEAGASMVKVFPSGMFGPRYLKELKGPFDKIKLMAVGGVRPDNIAEYFDNGADAVAFGAGIFKRSWLDSGNYSAIANLVSAYVCKCSRCAAPA